jgi:hypothetical protein
MKSPKKPFGRASNAESTGWPAPAERRAYFLQNKTARSAAQTVPVAGATDQHFCICRIFGRKTGFHPRLREGMLFLKML